MNRMAGTRMDGLGFHPVHPVHPVSLHLRAGTLANPTARQDLSCDYDAVGNMTSRDIGGTVYNLTYDAENRLTKVTGAATADFSYDGDGNRVLGIVGSVRTRYVGDYYEYEVGSGTVRKYYTHWGKRIALREGGTLYWLLTDHLGSTAIVTATTQSEVRYDAWGADRYTAGNMHTTYRFTGQRYESALKLYRMGARRYDPDQGTVDPRRGGKVEVSQCLLAIAARLCQAPGQANLATALDLVIQEQGQELDGCELPLRGLGGAHIQVQGHS